MSCFFTQQQQCRYSICTGLIVATGHKIPLLVVSESLHRSLAHIKHQGALGAIWWRAVQGAVVGRDLLPTIAERVCLLTWLPYKSQKHLLLLWYFRGEGRSLAVDSAPGEGKGRDGCNYYSGYGEPAQRTGDMHHGPGYILPAGAGEWTMTEDRAADLEVSHEEILSILDLFKKNFFIWAVSFFVFFYIWFSWLLLNWFDFKVF